MDEAPPPSSPDPKNATVLRLDLAGYVLAALLALYTIRAWSGSMFDPFLQNDDVRTIFFPFWNAVDGSFEGDYLAESMRSFSPWAYRWLVRLALLPGLDLLAVPKILQIASLVWAAVHGFRIGRRRAGGMGALLGLYLVLHCMPLLERSGGGLPRSFAMPIVLMAADALDARRPWTAGAAVVLGFMFYPPAGLITSIAFGAWSLVRVGLHFREPAAARRALVPLAVAAALSVAALGPSLRPEPRFGRITTMEEAKQLPEFAKGGRLFVLPLASPGEELLSLKMVLGRTSADRIPWPTSWPILPPDRVLGATLFDLWMILALLALVARLARPSPAPFLIAGAGLVAYALARGLAFRLYSPERMLLFSMPPAVLVLMTTALSDLGARRGDPRWPRWGALAAFALLAATQGVAFPGPVGITVDARPERELFDALAKLPPDALIAGHPRRLDNIPLWARRRILISYETSQPWFDAMWAEMKARTYASLDAYYATDAAPVRALRDRYGVDVMLVHELDLKPAFALQSVYYEPFGSYLRAKLKGVTADRLIWKRVPADTILARASGFMLIDLEKFLQVIEPVPASTGPPPGTDAAPVLH